jgi:hypothetical protein
LVLDQERLAPMLGLSQQRIGNLILDLIASKRGRAELKPGGDRGLSRTQALFLEPQPHFTLEDLCHKSTLVTIGIDGPALEPAVMRRFSSLFKQLGADDGLITLPPDEWKALNPENPNGTSHQLRVSDYRTLVWQQILDNRTLFLTTLKTARYSERKAYGDTATRVRNLIAQNQSPDLEQHSMTAAASSVPSASPPPPRPSNDERRVNPLPAGKTHAPAGFGGYGRKADPPHPAADPTIDEATIALQEFGTVDDELVSRLVRNCRAVNPQATGEHIAHFIRAKGMDFRKRRKDIRSIFGLLAGKVRPVLPADYGAVACCLTGNAYHLFIARERAAAAESPPYVPPADVEMPTEEEMKAEGIARIAKRIREE